MKYIPINFEKLSSNARMIRAYRGYTKKELAMIAKVNVKTIDALESNSSGMKVATLGIIAEALEISVVNIIEGDVFRWKRFIFGARLTK